MAQTTVPADIRALVHAKPGTRLVWSAMSDGTIIVRTKTKSILDMAGMLKAPKGKRVSVDDMNPWREGLPALDTTQTSPRTSVYFEVAVCLSQLIPSPPPCTVGAELPAFHQGAKVLLQRIATTASEPDGIGHGDAAMLTRELDDL